MFDSTEGKFYDVGTSTALITPKNKVSLFTFDGIERNNDILHSELEANAIIINHGLDLLIIVSLDLIWVDEIFTAQVQKWIDTEYNKYNSHLLLLATHSHSTPQISSRICNSARPNLSYISFLCKQVCKVISSAFNDKEKCYAELSITHPNLTINRRKKILSARSLKRGIIKTIIANRPNPNGARDDLLYTIWFYNSKDNEKAVLLNYACHTTLFRDNAVSSDFPGLVSKYLKSQLSKDLVVCFLQGFTGNIKANLVKSQCLNHGGVFSSIYNCLFDRVQFNKKVSQKQLESFSKKIAQFALLRHNPKKINPKIFFISKTIKLPLNSNNKLQYANLEVSYVSIGDELRIIALGGEIFAEYSLWLREFFLSKKLDLLTVGYCNGMVGYIPTFDAMLEGGYEVERSYKIFGYLFPFSSKLESILMKEVHKLIKTTPQENKI